MANRRKRPASRQASSLMKAIAAASGTFADGALGTFRRLAPHQVGRLAITEDIPPGNGETPNKGKRSQRRRAAKMRAAGFTHHDRRGWVGHDG